MRIKEGNRSVARFGQHQKLAIGTAVAALAISASCRAESVSPAGPGFVESDFDLRTAGEANSGDTPSIIITQIANATPPCESGTVCQLAVGGNPSRLAYGDDAAEPAQHSSPYRVSSLKRDLSSAALEIGALTAIITVPRVYRRFKQGSDPFHFNSEGWFSRNTYDVGMDKMHHAFKTYVMTDLLQSVISRRTGDKRSAAITAGIVGVSLMTYAEVFDGFSKSTGFSYEDGLVHFAGAGLSVVRNLVPGLRNKLDYRMEVKPSFDKDLLFVGNNYDHRKYLLALQLAGFKGLERSPLRFVELQTGYYARGIFSADRSLGVLPRRKVFFGIGFNVQQLFAKKPRSRIERWTKGAFDYIQVPYTAARW